MKPLKRNVILLKTNTPEQTESGIQLLNAENRNEATVLSVGPEVNEVKEGDIVILDNKVRHKVTKMEGDKFIAHVDDILAVKG
jgi:co-chaperonin GroES (HSP10)